MWTTGATDFSHPASHSKMKHLLMSWWHQLSGWSTTNLTSMFSLSHTLNTCPACAERSQAYFWKGISSVSAQIVAVAIWSIWNKYWLHQSQIKNKTSFPIILQISIRTSYSNIISNLMAIIFQVNDSTEFLHHLKASRNHPKQSEWQWAKWIEVAIDLTWDPPRSANEEAVRGSGWNLGSLKLKMVFFINRPHWQKDNHPLSIKTKEYPFQTWHCTNRKKDSNDFGWFVFSEILGLERVK